MSPNESNGDQPKTRLRKALKGLFGMAGKGTAAVSRGARWAAPHVANGSKKALGAARTGAVAIVSRIRKTDDVPHENGGEK